MGKLVVVLIGAFGEQSRSNGEWEIAETLLANGHDILLVNDGAVSQFSPKHFGHLEQVYGAPGKRWATAQCNLRSNSAVTRIVDCAHEQFGRLDALVYWVDYGFRSDQFSSYDSFSKTKAADVGLSGVERYMELHTLGLYYASVAVLNTFRRNKAESTTTHKIIALSTTLGFMGAPGFASYSASRGAAEGLLETIGYEARHLGVRTVSVDIGFPPARNPWELAAHALRFIVTPEPPLRVVLGRVAAAATQDKLRNTVEEIEDWKFLFPGDDGGEQLAG